MSQSEQVKTALSAADSAILLQSPAQVSRAAEAWSRCGMLGLDTEFVRERTYHANIGLVQISDGQTVWLLDPLVEGAIEPLAELLRNPDIRKIVHSPSEDFEVLLHAISALPEPVLDTQIACAMLGQPLQMGYHTAVEWLLGVAIDKDQTRSNWVARPLRPAQLRYAALDVCLLPLMWQKLEAALREKSRLAWFEEDCARQLEQARMPLDPANSWTRVRGIGRLDGASLAILQALAAWRENEARRRNLPRGFVITDRALLIIADRKIRDPHVFDDLEDIHPRAKVRLGEAITRMVAGVLDAGTKLPRIPQMTGKQRRLLKRMRERVLCRAEELEIEPSLLAPKREVEDLILNGSRNNTSGRLQGWRDEVIIGELIELLEGSGS